MREQIVALLNQHPSVIGIPFALSGLWELLNASFRYEAHRQGRERLLHRRPWLRLLGMRLSLPRVVAIVGALWILLIGVILIDAEIHRTPRQFWMIPLAVLTISFFIVFGVTKLRRWLAKQ